MEPSVPVVPHRIRSSFVTSTAWILIATSGIGVFVTLLQTIFFFVLVKAQDLDNAMKAASTAGSIPGFMVFGITHIRSIAALMLLVFCVLFTIGVGFLRRYDWARKGVIAFCALSIVFNLASSIGQYFIMRPQMAPGALAQFQFLFTVMNIAAYALSFGFSVALIFLIKRLCSRPLLEEFGSYRPLDFEPKINAPFHSHLK